MMKNEVKKIRAEIARLKKELKALEGPKPTKNKGTYHVVWSTVDDSGAIYSAGIQKTFKQFGAAMRLADRLASDYPNRNYAVMTPEEYDVNFEGVTRKVHNMMTGKMQEESVTTPYSCSVASESYWCN